MKYGIRITKAFKKNRKLMKKRGLDLSLLDDVIFKLANGIKLDEKHHDHELAGTYKGFRECHIKPNWLLIYLINDNILVLTLIDTGSHSDLLKT